MDRKKLIEYAENHGLQRVARQIASLSHSCIRLKTIPTEENAILISQSKFGRNPDVPPDFEWPEWQGVRLAFIAQINLSEIPQTEQTHILPKTGLLSFFYHPDQTTWGFDPKDQGSWRSYYFPTDHLKRMPTPPYNSEYMDAPYPSCAVEYQIVQTLPQPGDDALEKLQFTKEEKEAYWGFEDMFHGKMPLHQLLGRPYEIQNPMEIECELVSKGIYVGDGKWIHRPDIAEYKQQAKDWLLLLQVDSDDKANMMWGDAGMLYYWIKKENIKAQKFSETWMVLQCC